MNKLITYIGFALLLTGCKEPGEDTDTKPSLVVEEEPVGLQVFSSNWTRLESPTVEPDRYVSADGLTYSGSGGGLMLYAVDRNTNLAKPMVFYPGFNDWDPRFYSDGVRKDAPMRFGPFRANFMASGGVDATMMGGGYYKQANGERFFLKNFRIEGIDGYSWDPPYPGADALTSSFGVSGYGYVLENKADGKLWRFDPATIKWQAVGAVPVAKEARFVSFDVGERAFVLVESDNWSDPLEGLYEFLATTGKWEKRKAFAGENRRRAVAFTINNRLYYGAGQSAQTLKPLRDIWTYDPTTDAWQKVSDYPGFGTINLVGFGLGNLAYLGFGQQVTVKTNKGEAIKNVNDFWRFRP